MKKITLFVFLLVASFGFSQELITNGDFQTGAAGDWYTGGENNPIEIVDQGGNFVFQANVTGTTDAWRVNLSQVVALQDNTAYELSFDAFTDSATGSRPLNVSLGQAAGPFAGTTPTIETITDTPQTFTYTITTNFDTNNGGSGSRVIFDMGDNVGFVFIDNVSLTAATVDPTTDASLSDLALDGTTVAGFSSSTLSYPVELPSGTMTAPTVSATTTEAMATTMITQAPSLPGDATVAVTASDGTTMSTYTVSFTVAQATLAPTTPAPTPPNREATAVVNIFSGAYAGGKTLTPDTFGVAGNNSTAMIGTIMGDDYWGIDFDGGDFMGFNLDSEADASAMTHFHMDYWVEGTPTGGVMNPKWSNHSAGHLTGETNAAIHTFAPAGPDGQWLSLDIEITQFNVGEFNGGINPGTNREFLSQLVFGASGASAALFDNIYFDNMYFHNNTVLNIEDFETASFKAFPNPTNGEWNISGNSVVNTIAVYDILGKQVLALEPNSNDFTINAASLRTGVYFAKIEGVNGSQTIKLVKQ
ncbi:T9SS type A sorting domain-containing protein [Winogradskyella sp. PE311]|uniref:T9SS type A sorting domain-containing protein n=1 Tax=Winogradskyella sp. PE311 TaxID=3366943 RepID=UPI00397F2105